MENPTKLKKCHDELENFSYNINNIIKKIEKLLDE